jgi:hypothetical protein
MTAVMDEHLSRNFGVFADFIKNQFGNGRFSIFSRRTKNERFSVNTIYFVKPRAWGNILPLSPNTVLKILLGTELFSSKYF